MSTIEGGTFIFGFLKGCVYPIGRDRFEGGKLLAEFARPLPIRLAKLLLLFLLVGCADSGVFAMRRLAGQAVQILGRRVAVMEATRFELVLSGPVRGLELGLLRTARIFVAPGAALSSATIETLCALHAESGDFVRIAGSCLESQAVLAEQGLVAQGALRLTLEALLLLASESEVATWLVVAGAGRQDSIRLRQLLLVEGFKVGRVFHHWGAVGNV